MPKEKEVKKEHLPQEELDKLWISPDRNKKTEADVMRLAKIDQPKESKPAAQQQTDSPVQAKTTSEIMHLDPKHDQEIKQKLNDAAKAYFQISFDQCTPLQKAETIQRALKDPDFFSFQYDKDYNGPPRTVEESYTSEPKSGNCDEFSRLFLAIATKEYVGLKDLSQFYVMFKSETTGKNVGHTAIFYLQGRIIFIDPSLDEFDPPFPKTFKTPRRSHAKSGF